MTDLESEFDRCLDPLDERQSVSRFVRQGVPTSVLFGPRSLCGIGRITSYQSGLFDFAEDGEWAMVIAEGEPDLPGWHCLDDLIAFKPADPGNWFLRRGAVDLLGAYNLGRPWRLDPTPLHATPLEWLRGGAQGVCVLNWTLDPFRTLLGGPALVEDSPALRERLRQRVLEVAEERFNNCLIDRTQEALRAAA